MVLLQNVHQELGFADASLKGKEPAYNVGDTGDGFNLWVRKILWRRKWQPTPVFLFGKPHGQRSLVSYSPKICKESDMTERLNMNTDTHKATSAAAAKSLQSCPTLCDPIDRAHQAPPSLGFSRQEHWSGLPFPSPKHEHEK